MNQMESEQTKQSCWKLLTEKALSNPQNLQQYLLYFTVGIISSLSSKRTPCIIFLYMLPLFPPPESRILLIRGSLEA